MASTFVLGIAHDRADLLERRRHATRLFHGDRSTPLQIFSEVDDATRFLEAQCAMSEMARFVVDERVGTEFRAPLLDGPALGGSDQRAANAPPSEVGVDVPPLQIRDVMAAAAVDDIANREFNEADGSAVFVEREQHFRRFVAIAGEKLVRFSSMLVEIAWP